MEAAVEVEAVEETRWLSGEEQQAWFALAGMVSWLPDVLDAQLQRDAGISHFEYSVMAMLSMSPERTMRMSEVAALANGALPRLSRTVDRLEKRGWVTRRPDPHDGRSTPARLPAPPGAPPPPPPPPAPGGDRVVPPAPGPVAEARRVVFAPLRKPKGRQLH